MTVNPVWGQILTPDDVEAAMEATLRLWLPSALRELERQKGRDAESVQSPASYGTVNDFDQIRGNQLPAIVIVSPGTDDVPRRSGDGSYQMSFGIGVAVIVQAKDRAAAKALANVYAGAVMTLVLQNGTLGGFADGVELGAITLTDAPTDFLDVGYVARLAFSVTVSRVVTDLLGPSAPDPDPAPLPTVETVQIDVEKGALT